jgi:sn-glycerol 3-phosphate transport system permease protein
VSRLRTSIHASLLLLPAVVLLAAFTHVPAVRTFIGALYTTPRGKRPAVFVGLDNYRQLLDDPVFWQAMANNVWYAALTIPLSVVGGRSPSMPACPAVPRSGWPISRPPCCR